MVLLLDCQRSMITHRGNPARRDRFPLERQNLSKHAQSARSTCWSGRSYARFSWERLDFEFFTAPLHTRRRLALTTPPQLWRERRLALESHEDPTSQCP